MFVAKSQKLARLPAGVHQYWCSAVLRHANVRQLADGEYRKTSIPNNGVHPPVVGHGNGFAVEDSCEFKDIQLVYILLERAVLAKVKIWSFVFFY